MNRAHSIEIEQKMNSKSAVKDSIVFIFNETDSEPAK